jgi:hypothetical protein
MLYQEVGISFSVRMYLVVAIFASFIHLILLPGPVIYHGPSGPVHGEHISDPLLFFSVTHLRLAEKTKNLSPGKGREANLRGTTLLSLVPAGTSGYLYG